MNASLSLFCKDDAIKEDVAKVIHEFEEIIKNLKKWTDLPSK